MYGLGDVMCPDGSIVGDGVLCPSQAPPASSSSLPVAYGPGSSPVAVQPTFTQWLNNNSSLVMIGAGAFVVLALFTGGRRR